MVQVNRSCLNLRLSLESMNFDYILQANMWSTAAIISYLI